MATDGLQWRDITNDERVNAKTDIFIHQARIYIECGCGEHFHWWDTTSEVHLCPGCGKPYRALSHVSVHTYE